MAWLSQETRLRKIIKLYQRRLKAGDGKVIILGIILLYFSWFLVTHPHPSAQPTEWNSRLPGAISYQRSEEAHIAHNVIFILFSRRHKVESVFSA